MQPEKTLQWAVLQNNESLVVTLNGELTRNTLLPLWKQRASFLSPTGNQQVYWDLAGLTHLDSAGFTLLAELLHHYGKQTPNYLIHVPEVVFTLADLYDLDEWLAQYTIKSR